MANGDIAACGSGVAGVLDAQEMADDPLRQMRFCLCDDGGALDGIGGGDHDRAVNGREVAIEYAIEPGEPIDLREVRQSPNGVPLQNVVRMIEERRYGSEVRIDGSGGEPAEFAQRLTGSEFGARFGRVDSGEKGFDVVGGRRRHTSDMYNTARLDATLGVLTRSGNGRIFKLRTSFS